MHAQGIAPIASDQRRTYYDRISAQNLTPLWEVLDALVPTSPRSPAVSALWRYGELRPQVMEAGALITAAEAERRVLILENPALRGLSCITHTLYAGLQLILPGEVAPAHRHTQSALRLVLDGEGAYTAVDGERTTMHRGDFIVTPTWTWHDHGNTGDQPVVWLDGLDIPLVQFFDAGFAEKSSETHQAELRAEGDALARFGANMLPVDFQQQTWEPTRLFAYPHARTEASLREISRSAPDPHLGFKLRYVNPATGASPMPTIGAFAQRLPAGFETQPYRCTDGTIYVCLEGQGEAEINDAFYSFSENDIFVVPSWHTLRLRASRDALLFSYSDRPAQQVLGLWREQRL